MEEWRNEKISWAKPFLCMCIYSESFEWLIGCLDKLKNALDTVD